MYTDHELLGGRTGSAFLAHARNLEMDRHEGRILTDYEQAQVQLALRVFDPEYFYMDGELFS